MKRLLLILVAVVGALNLLAGEPTRVVTCYHDSVTALDGSAVTFPLPADALTIALEARCSLTAHKEPIGESKHSWGIVVGDYPERYILFTVRPGTDGFSSSPYMRLAAELWADDELQSTLGDVKVTDGISSTAKGENTLMVDIDPATGEAVVSLGTRVPAECLRVGFEPGWHPAEWGVVSDTKAAVVDLKSRLSFSALDEYMTPWTEAALNRRFASSTDPLEGYWDYLDRDNDPLLAVPGGYYRLALVATDDGGYDIIYVSGAETNASSWRAGMRRGHLAPTRFVDSYDLEWVDASFHPLARDTYATVEQGCILTLSFPIYKTKMRFAKAQ